MYLNNIEFLLLAQFLKSEYSQLEYATAVNVSRTSDLECVLCVIIMTVLVQVIRMVTGDKEAFISYRKCNSADRYRTSSAKSDAEF
jgi:hypothetical protein